MMGNKSKSPSFKKGKPGIVKMSIHTVDNTGSEEELTNQITGLKLIETREMTRQERRANTKRSCIPVVLEFEDGSKIYAFMPEIHHGHAAYKKLTSKAPG